MSLAILSAVLDMSTPSFYASLILRYALLTDLLMVRKFSNILERFLDAPSALRKVL